MSWHETRIDRTTDANGKAYFIGYINLGRDVYAMSASVFEFPRNEPNGLGDAFFEVTQFEYRYNSQGSSAGRTRVDVRVAAIHTEEWFRNGTRRLYAREGLRCSIILRYGRGTDGVTYIDSYIDSELPEDKS